MRFKKPLKKNQEKFFVLTSSEAYNAKLKHREAQKQRELDKSERIRQRDMNAAKRRKQLLEKAAAAEKRKIDRESKRPNRRKIQEKQTVSNEGTILPCRSDDSNNRDIYFSSASHDNNNSALSNAPSSSNVGCDDLSKCRAVDDVSSGVVSDEKLSSRSEGVDTVSISTGYDVFACHGVDIGDFVVVDFEGKRYPGQVSALRANGAIVSVLHQSGVNWKWPKVSDAIFYDMSEIKQKIQKPLHGRRETFIVPELSKVLD